MYFIKVDSLTFSPEISEKSEKSKKKNLREKKNLRFPSFFRLPFSSKEFGLEKEQRGFQLGKIQNFN